MSNTLTEAIRFQRDLYLYWHEVSASGELPLNPRGYLTRAATRRVARRLAGVDGLTLERVEGAESEEMRLFYLRRLLQRLRLLERTQTASAAAVLAAAPPREMQRYLTCTLAERLRISARVWVAGGWWPDRQSPQTPPPRLMLPAPPRVALARQRLLDELTLLAQPDEASAGMGTSATVEEETRRAALSGPLRWMGFVEVQDNLDREEHPRTPPGSGERARRTYRPTSAVLALRVGRAGSEPDLHDAQTALAEVHGRIVIQSNFEVVAFPPLTGPILALLNACAEEVALERTARFRLTRRAFAVAHQQQWSAAALIQRLESAAGSPLPENVRITLGDWQRQAERLRVMPTVRLLEVQDASLLDALMADRAMVSHILQRITDVAAVISADGVAEVRAWLLQHGELPSVKDKIDMGASGYLESASSDHQEAARKLPER